MAPAMKEEVDFPSGSNWGIPQLKALNFPLQPESHPFEDLQWEHDLSKESLDILHQLQLGFGLHKDEWVNGSDDPKYQDFYDELNAMLPRVEAKQLTPERAVRSNTKLPSSSERGSSSPCSVKSIQRPAPYSAERTTSKDISPAGDLSDSELDLGVIPTPTLKRRQEDFTRSPSPLAKRQREDPTRSPSLPPNRPTPIADTATTAFCDIEFPSSQTDSTFRSFGRSSSVSGDERLDRNRPESQVTILIRSLLTRICKAHGDCDGYKFFVDDKVETFVIPICGDIPTSKPDLLVRMQRGKRTYSIVDYEVCVLCISVLMSSSTKLWLYFRASD